MVPGVHDPCHRDQGSCKRGQNNYGDLPDLTSPVEEVNAACNVEGQEEEAREGRGTVARGERAEAIVQDGQVSLCADGAVLESILAAVDIADRLASINEIRSRFT